MSQKRHTARGKRLQCDESSKLHQLEGSGGTATNDVVCPVLPVDGVKGDVMFVLRTARLLFEHSM